MKEFLTKNFIGIIVIILGVLLYFQRCNNDATSQQPPDTVTHTYYIQQPPVYIPQYTPAPITVQPPIIIPPSYTPNKDYDKLLEQYNKLVNRHLESKTYQDSIELKDTAGRKVGVVNLKDVVSENEIKLRSPSYQLSFPHTTTIITQQSTPRNQFYVGGAVLGNQDKLLSGAKVGIFLKNKRDQLYSIEAQKQIGVPITYGVGMYWKIKLRK